MSVTVCRWTNWFASANNPHSFWSLSSHFDVFPGDCPERLPRCDHNPGLWSLEGVPLSLGDGGAAGLKRWGINRKRPCLAGVVGFLAAGVSSHYFSSLRGPTGTTLMDRYILGGIAGTNIKRKRSLSSIITSFHDGGIVLLTHGAERQTHLSCTHWDVYFSVHFGLRNNIPFALKLQIISKTLIWVVL